MVKRITIIWVLGLITLAPYAAYYLIFDAHREGYAQLITFILFWIFGFWGVIGPILSTIKIRKVFKVLEQVDSKEKLQEIISRKESEDVALEFIASENKIPKLYC